MFLIQVRNDLWWIFNIKKRSQLVKTIRLSTHIDIFDEKKFSKFFLGMGGQKVKIFFWFSDVIFPEKLIRDNEFVEKNLNGGVLTNFCRKVRFWGPYWPLNYFSRAPLNLSRQDASFKYTYDYIFDHNFFDQKSGKIGRNSKISPPSSWSLIFASGFIFSFFDMVNIQKVSILPPFLGYF